jgi:glycosyltransferase involved in cell wall biosynthesis
MSCLRICLLASTYPRFPGDGAGRFMHSIAEALAKQQHEVHVVVPYHPAIRALSGPVHIHPFQYIWPHRWAIMGHAAAMDSDRRLHRGAFALAPFYFLSGLRKLIQLTARYRFDIFHAHWVIPAGPIAAIAAKLVGKPLIISLHGSDLFFASKHRLLKPIAQACFGQATAVTACSPQLREGALALGAAPERTELILWGADPQLFMDNQGVDSERLRQQLNILPGSPIILNLGRLVEKKGVEFLVQAMPAVCRQHPSAVLIIAGDGPERPRLAEIANRLGIATHVRFVGNVPWPQVAGYLQISDLFVVPSIEDGSGNLDGLPTTIFEAMAAGVPVVASNVAGIPLAVLHGQTGLLVEQRQPDRLAEAINALLTEPSRRQQMGCTARRLVESELNWDRVAREFISLYKKGLG